MVYAKFFSVLLIIAGCWNFVFTASWKSTPKIVPKDYPIIIGCINEITWEIKKPLNQEYSACYHWTKGWKNLRFPSKSQLKMMKEVYKTRAWVVTAMTLMNHESQFNRLAKWCHKGGCDYGLFQIRDVNGWKNMTDRQQMEWFKNRKAWQMSPSGNCYQHKDSWQQRMLRCIFARHNWVLDWFARYPSKRLEEWKFYTSLNF